MATARNHPAKPDDRTPEPEGYASRIRLFFEDGTFSKWINPNRPTLLAALEAEYGVGRPESTVQVMWYAWNALGRPGVFDEWWPTVEDIQERNFELGKAY